MKVLIYGNDPVFNRDEFSKVESYLKKLGHCVANPSLFLNKTDSDSIRLRKIVSELVNCQGIYLIPGWNMDENSAIVYNLANQLKVALINQSAEYVRFKYVNPIKN